MTTSSRLDFDYDYPCNIAKPVKNASEITSSNYQTPTSSRFVSPIPSSYRIHAQATQPAKSNGNAGGLFTSLETVVPLPSVNSTPGMGCYYDVPKNIPVNPIFASKTPSRVITSKFPVSNGVAYNKPTLPQKSSAVLNKMSSYPSSPNTNYSNSPANDANYMNRFGTLTKQSTSKPLPPLPNSENNNNNNKNNNSNNNNNNNSSAISTVKPVPNPANRQFISTANLQNDDDDEDCDYDYDYVCLESKKKLDDEDESVKKLISKDLQLRYERLALNSSGFLDLQNLEKSLQSRSIANPSTKSQFLLSYRHFLSISLRNFESWTKLNLEIIERNPPPNVYINFTKHILLSGQNLLLVAKSLNRHFGQIESLSSFADSFYDYLRQIVVKTKKSASVYPSPKFTKEMVESITAALRFANNLNIDFNRYMHTL